jgi:hypothetical protein
MSLTETRRALEIIGDDTGRSQPDLAGHSDVRKHQIRTDRGDLYRCHECGLFTFGAATGLDAFECRQGAVTDE